MDGYRGVWLIMDNGTAIAAALDQQSARGEAIRCMIRRAEFSDVPYRWTNTGKLFGHAYLRVWRFTGIELVAVPML